MLDIENVFLFSDSDKRESFRAQNENDYLTKEYLFSLVEDGDTIQFSWLQGKKYYDVIATDYSGIYLVSEKTQSILKGSGFKGYSLRPITLTNQKNELVHGYQLLSVVSKVGPIINEKSEKKMMPPLVPWGDPYEEYVGLYFDVSMWDGSDFFYPEGTSYVFVVEEVKRLFEAHKVTNCRFQKVVELANYGIR